MHVGLKTLLRRGSAVVIDTMAWAGLIATAAIGSGTKAQAGNRAWRLKNVDLVARQCWEFNALALG